MSKPRVALVIIHWNRRDFLEQFLPSVVKSNYENLEIIVVDNASADDSIKFLKENYPSIRLIRHNYNYGYAGGYNRALSQVNADYYILLNNDIEVPEHWIDPIIERMESDHRIAACQPKILQFKQKDSFEYAGAGGGFIDRFGYVFCRGRIFESIEVDQGQYNEAMPVFWATGACLALRADAFHEVHGFDENFFAHMEEVDLCWRLQLAGYDIWVEPASHVFHVGGGTLSKIRPQKTYLNFKNSLVMLLKNLPLSIGIWLIPIRTILDFLSSLYFLMNGEPRHSWAIHRAHYEFFFRFRKWYRLRAYIKRKRAHQDLKGVYPGSIVYEHFIRRTTSFSELEHTQLLVK
jgi:GT2 family glycosyltransferase